jgi:hypothetical protein
MRFLFPASNPCLFLRQNLLEFATIRASCAELITSGGEIRLYETAATPGALGRCQIRQSFWLWQMSVLINDLDASLASEAFFVGAEGKVTQQHDAGTANPCEQYVYVVAALLLHVRVGL